MKKKTAIKKPAVVPILTKHSLAEKVEHLVHRDHIKYSEAIVQICDDLQIDPADVAKLVTGPLHAKVEAEAIRYRVIPRKHNTATLD